MRDIQYESEKEVKVKIDSQSITSQEYYDFLNVFSKKNSNTLFSYQKYGYKIWLEEKQKPGHALLYKMFLEEVNAI